ncbi:MAG: SNF2 helicase associated domain-containing protein [Pirellulaceae bacterium]
MNTLEQLFGSQFTSLDRSRGATYFKENRVFDLINDKTGFYAIVEGNADDYSVALVFAKDQSGARITCDCPRFNDGFPCKHIWATILAVDQSGAYHRLQGASKSSSKSKSNRRDTKANRKSKSKPAIPAWQAMLKQADFESELDDLAPINKITSPSARIVYVIDVSENHLLHFELKVLSQPLKKDGRWGVLRRHELSEHQMEESPDQTDRVIARQLLGAQGLHQSQYWGYDYRKEGYSEFEITPEWASSWYQTLIDSGRFFWTLDGSLPIEEFHSIQQCDVADPYRFSFRIEDSSGEDSQIIICIERDGNELEPEQIVQIASDGMCLTRSGICRIENPSLLPMWQHAQAQYPITIRKSERKDFLTQLAGIQGANQVQLPESWNVDRKQSELQPVLSLSDHPHQKSLLGAEVTYDYAGSLFKSDDHRTQAYDPDTNTWIERNQELETSRLNELVEFPFSSSQYRYDDLISIHKKHLVPLVDKLSELGWKVLLHSKPLRNSGHFDISVESGQDWFDLQIDVAFGDQHVEFPKLLHALRNKQEFVELADGSRGRLPNELIEKHAKLVGLGKEADGKIRFRSSQALLLDALLSTLDHVRVDRDFEKIRKQLQSFSGIKPSNPPRGFNGELRPYQSEGYSWLNFLRIWIRWVSGRRHGIGENRSSSHAIGVAANSPSVEAIEFHRK